MAHGEGHGRPHRLAFPEAYKALFWGKTRPPQRKGARMLPLAIAGTGYGLIGLLVIVLLVVLILALVRRA